MTMTMTMTTTRNAVLSRIADAAEALRVANIGLVEAAGAYDADERFNFDMIEASLNAEIFANLLDAETSFEDIGGRITLHAEPSLEPRVFRTLRRYQNNDPHNPRYLEGAVLALKLAEQSLDAAIELCHEHDVDDGYSIAFAARGVVRQFGATLECQMYRFQADEALAKILAGKPARASKRQLVAA